MTDYLILLKKELGEMFSFRKKAGKKLDLLGIILTMFLTLGITAVIVFTYRAFIDVFTGIPVAGTNNPRFRLNQALTITYAVIILINIVVGVKKINSDILEGKDFAILVRLPITPQSIFMAKLTALFISQVLSTLITLLPLTLIAGLVVHQTIGFWIRSILMCLLLPMISLMIAAVLALIVHYVLRFLKSRFSLLASVFVIMLAGAFLLYTDFLQVVKTLLVNGEINRFFNDKTISLIEQIAQYAYPANFCAKFVVGEHIIVNLLITLGISVGALLIAVLIVMKMLTRVMKSGNDGGIITNFRRNSSIKTNGTIWTLIKKEFTMVIRTPNYSFQYIATTLTLPLMVYCSIMLFSDFINSQLMLQCNFELAIFIIIMFSTLTNTFCASNISREGEMFNIEKTLPCTHRDIIYSKVIFCSVASVLAVVASALLIFFTGYVTLGELIGIATIAAFISLSEVFFATRKDLNHPQFANNQTNEITESTRTISVMIVSGILLSTLMGGGALACAMFLKVTGSAPSMLITIVFLALITVIVFVASLIYLLKGLSKKFYNTVNG